MKLFDAQSLGPITIKNAMVMAPMCIYGCTQKDGIANNFHIAHYGARAIGQVGLIILESTGVMANGRITDLDLGLYNDDQILPLKKVVETCHQQGAKVAIQLGHAGRKSKCEETTPWAPSAIAFDARYKTPKQMTRKDIETVIEAFRSAAIRADQAGFDGIEVHGAHGYLIHQFLSPLTNYRNDAYGEDKVLFLKQILTAIREVWPKEKALWIRVSGEEYDPQGYEVRGLIELLKPIIDLVDAIHVSAGGNSSQPREVRQFPGYMLDNAKRIKEKLNIPVIGVGLLKTPQIVKSSFEKYPLDFVAVGKKLLSNPNFYLDCCAYYGRLDLIHPSYIRAYE